MHETGCKSGTFGVLRGIVRLCKGVLGSGENGVKTAREQGAWLQKTRDQGAKEINLGSREHGQEGHGAW